MPTEKPGQIASQLSSARVRRLSRTCGEETSESSQAARAPSGFVLESIPAMTKYVRHMLMQHDHVVEELLRDEVSQAIDTLGKHLRLS